MKTFVAVLLVSSIAFASAPSGTPFLKDEDTVKATEKTDTDSPVLAPDVPNLSVRLRAGETAPFDGRLIALEENLRRGRAKTACDAELEDAKTNVWTSKGLLVGVVIGALVLGAAAGAGVTVWALKKSP